MKKQIKQKQPQSELELARTLLAFYMGEEGLKHKAHPIEKAYMRIANKSPEKRTKKEQETLTTMAKILYKALDESEKVFNKILDNG